MLIVLGLWAWLAFVRLQQRWLLSQCEGALDVAEELGLVVAPNGFQTRLVARGVVADGPVRVYWRTGLLGPRTVIRGPDGIVRLPLLRTSQALRVALIPQPEPASD
ncbi:MAG: hypothetical protein GXP62_08480 [Oligoflexia bacterium]|nr:hypothetical protein [Oligoflexia bacterium]